MTNPIFIFSAGWRSGSTMLQRVITSTQHALIWGESGGALNSIADAYARYDQMLGIGEKKYKHGFGGNGLLQYKEFLSESNTRGHNWIACMNIEVESILNALKSFFHSIYVLPSINLGYKNWGVKEVEAGLDTASFIKMLYPEAKFVFLVRNPIACMTSIKRHNWLDRPNDPNALRHYAEHWASLANDFRKSEFGFYVRYEDLISSKETQDKLSNYLEIDALSSHVKNARHVDWEKSNTDSLSFFEKKKLRRLIQAEMKEHGYTFS